MVAVMNAMRMSGIAQSPPITHEAPREQIHEHYKMVEQYLSIGGPILHGPYMHSPDVATETVTIKGVDGNDINLHIHTPKNTSGPIPCVYHIHGGGMGVMSTNNEYYNAVRTSIAKKGMAAVGVEFRNSTGNLGPHPFPAGLNDCTSGLQWVFDNKSARGYSKVPPPTIALFSSCN
jgi:acetyl esterase